MIATLSHTATIDGEAFAGLTTENLAIEVGAEQTLPEIDAALVGMKAGESKQVDFKLSDDFPNKNLAGKQVAIDLQVSEVQESILPTLDDEFAKDLGLDTIQKLKDNIRNHYEAQHERSRRAELESALMEQIIKGNSFDVPPVMVATVIDDMIDQMQWNNDDEKRRAKGDQEFRKRFVDQAKRKAQNTLVLWEIAKRESIEVTDEDVDKHIVKSFLQGQAPQNEKDEQFMNQIKKSIGSNFRDNLIFEKSLDFLIDNAKIKEVNKKS
jgi:trigger factor